jgi:hypothetical protein
MLLGPQAEAVAVVPLNLTVLVPWVVPKFVPEITTEPPTDAEVGEVLVMVGPTVNTTPLLGTPLMVITTGPVVAAAGTGTTI